MILEKINIHYKSEKESQYLESKNFEIIILGENDSTVIKYIFFFLVPQEMHLDRKSTL